MSPYLFRNAREDAGDLFMCNNKTLGINTK